MTLSERLRQKISGAFYRHGLLCASYPVPIILFTAICILACWRQFVNVFSLVVCLQYMGPPVAYIQQVLVKAVVSPWDQSLLPVDIFRSPLAQVFQLVEEIRNHVHRDSYPLLKLPLPGTGPEEYTTAVRDYSPPPSAPRPLQMDPSDRPDWYVGPPVAYIQQVLVKAVVSPWDQSLLPVDIFRSPLAQVFQLVEEIRNHVHRDSTGSHSLDELCLQVTDLSGLKKVQSQLPEHGCLLISPGNFWQNERERFDSDADIIRTVHQHEPKGLHTSATVKVLTVCGYGTGSHSLDELCLQVTDLSGLKKVQSQLPEHGCLLISPGNFWQNERERFDSDADIIRTVHQHEPKGLHTSATVKDLLFGVPGKYSGLSLYNRKRVVSYTITIALQSYHARFLSSLRSRLKQLHPSVNCSLREDQMVHVHFKEEIGIVELIPLVTTYIILFAYIYFSTRKIDMVKSKWGLALAAVVTVLSSLLMSVGLCTLFGLTPTLNGGEIFPYLVVVIGLENVLVLTKSVVSTPVDLEVKLRIAQVYSCRLINTLSQIHQGLQVHLFTFTAQCRGQAAWQSLCSLVQELREIKQIGGPKPSSFRNLRLPKRLRVIYFLARTRLAQRIIMAGTVIWIGILVYTDPAGLRTYLAAQVSEQSPLGESGGLPPLSVPPVFPGVDPESTLTVLPHPEPTPLLENQSRDQPRPPWTSQRDQPPGQDNTPEISWSPPDEETWRRLSFRHWPSLFSYYNITLAKRYISILPVIPVSFYLSAQEAVEARHPQDAQRFHSPFPGFDMRADQAPEPPGKTLSQPDFTLYKVAALGLAAGVVLVLLLFCLYRVLCPRNYGQNGLSHGRRRHGELPCDDYGYSPPISEISPLLLRGHHMDIECLASDGMLLVSCCLARQIRVWDAQTGDCLTVIPDPRLCRSSSGVWERQENCEPEPEEEGLEAVVGGYPLRRRLLPSRPILFGDQPDLTPLIDTNFSEQPTCPGHASKGARGGFHFGGQVERAYEEHGATTPNLQGYPPSPVPCSPCRRRSQGDEPLCSPDPRPATCLSADPGDWDSAVWALELQGSLIAAGRSSGKLENCSCEAERSRLTHLVHCAHHKPITVLRAAAGRVVTGSQDHTVRTMVLASGGQDGAICLWDVLTGCRVSHMYGHRGDVTSLICTTSCVISSGLDDLICIWDRSTGIKLYSIQQEVGCGASLGVISESLLVTGGQGCVSFWDLSYGDLLQTVYLGKSNEGQGVRQLRVLDNAAIVCDFGSELSLVYVPSVLEKLD
ncbi:UNVERIFIED_CONTAM: hypothetical protein FKN15_059705 [Acipenser sinensis]